jgi:hypothetical protein
MEGGVNSALTKDLTRQARWARWPLTFFPKRFAFRICHPDLLFENRSMVRSVRWWKMGRPEAYRSANPQLVYSVGVVLGPAGIPGAIGTMAATSREPQTFSRGRSARGRSGAMTQSSIPYPTCVWCGSEFRQA